jgi:hypothetical protein
MPHAARGFRDKTYVRVKPSENDTEYEVLVVMRRINETELDAGGNDGHCGSFDREADETENDSIGVLETSLRLPQDANECGRGEDVGDNRADQPYTRQ